jgi:hypothetical protein
MAMSSAGSTLKWSCAVVALVVAALVSATGANAGAPLQLGPFTTSYDDIGMNCSGLDIRIHGAETVSVTVFWNSDGSIARVVRYDSAPHDVLTNLVTGRSIVVRAEFVETMTPIPGTDEAAKTVDGFRYLVNEPGKGATIRDVGRISYGDLEQTILLSEAGEHDLALDSEIDPTFCAALA